VRSRFVLVVPTGVVADGGSSATATVAAAAVVDDADV